LAAMGEENDSTNGKRAYLFTGRSSYTDREDDQIVAHLKSRGTLKKSYPGSVWQEMEQLQITKRSADSMRSRYRDIIYPTVITTNKFIKKKDKVNEATKTTTNTTSTTTATRLKTTSFSPRSRKEKDSEQEKEQEEGDQDNNEIDGGVQGNSDFEGDLLENLLESPSPQTPTKRKSEYKNDTDNPKKSPRKSNTSANDEYKKNNKTMPTQAETSESTLEEIQKHVHDIAEELGVHENVVWHAFMMFSGDVDQAKNFLKLGKNYPVKPWTLKDDETLWKDDKSIDDVRQKHGNQQVLERLDFLALFQ